MNMPTKKIKKKIKKKKRKKRNTKTQKFHRQEIRNGNDAMRDARPMV
jgi:hypothetical protein